MVATPALSGRPGFTADLQGHTRSAYSPLPSIIAAGLAAVLHTAHLVDLAAPLVPTLTAKLTASLLTALAVACAFVVARRRLSPAMAAAVAIGFGLGTNLWAIASQTLWQTETVVAALTATTVCLAVPAASLTTAGLWAASLSLGLAGAARPQLAPMVAVLGLSIAVRRRRASDVVALLPVTLVAITAILFNIHWFGHALGATPTLESLHETVHGLRGSWGNPLAGAAGLLLSPSRGLLVFSPIVLVSLAGLRTIAREPWSGDLRWWGLAALAQFALYTNYSVWWGGHTYGPRYSLDILPLLVPIAAAGLPWIVGRRWSRTLAAAALAWSLLIAGTGAFVYPYDGWNVSPSNVDQNHGRLWDWSDPQFVRCWRAGWSPSNFNLFNTAGFSKPGPPAAGPATPFAPTR